MRIAIIGGTGFGASLVDGLPETRQTEYGAAEIVRGSLGEGDEVIFLARHGLGHLLPPHRINHHANIAALRDLGVRAVFATAAVGSLRKEIAPGHIVVLSDFLDFMRGMPITFFNEPGNVRHTDFVEPYNPLLREILLDQADEELRRILHARGTYLCVSGPRYETPAEIRFFAALGADVVGMTGAPEAILCREAGLAYAAVALVTNYGAGLLDASPLSHHDVETVMAQSRASLARWLLQSARSVPGFEGVGRKDRYEKER